MGLGFNITTLLSGLCLAYISHTVWTMYHMFHVPQCDHTTSQCIESWLFLHSIDGNSNTALSLSIYGSENNRFKPTIKDEVLYVNQSFNVLLDHEILVNVSLPQKTFRSGKYYLHVYLVPPNLDLLSAVGTVKPSPHITHVVVDLTQLQVPQLTAFNLMGGTKAKETTPNQKAVPHLKSRVTLSVMTDQISLDQSAVPAELYQHIYQRIDQKTRSYLPIALIDELSFRLKDLQIIEKDKKAMPLTIVYKPMSVGKLKLWTNFAMAFNQLKAYGFGEKEVDEVKGVFADTNLYFLIMTFCVSALHILFDTLAFKNDISYWRKRNTMVGLSRRAVVWRCVSTIIILFYLIDSETSLLVSVPTGISALIEIWKLKKAFKVKFNLSRKPVTFGSTSDAEKETEGFDATAMSYLSYVLYPLVIAGAVYSLLYTPHKSWYSWAVQSLVNGVYAFGFLFMLPQLFVNYKLKSVAHLPWKAFMYKAFNTFIDDIFAFIITMPTAHRVACFRDDLVFVIYLYQRWLYPVDKKRVNEFGQSFEEPCDGDSKLKSE